MMPLAADLGGPRSPPAPDAPHVLLVIGSARAQDAVARRLLDAGFRVSSSAGDGLAGVLLEAPADFDLLVTAQSCAQMAQFGLPQLARSVRPDLPILVLEAQAAGGAGVLDAVLDAIERWPLRARAPRPCH